MFAIKFSMEKLNEKFWIAGFFLPAINATVFSNTVRRELYLEVNVVDGMTMEVTVIIFA